MAWSDQALLYHHVGVDGEWMPGLEAAGVGTASDLPQKDGLDLSAPHTIRNAPFFSRVAALSTFAKALDEASKARSGDAPPPPESVITEICTALWQEENMQYILNFRSAVAKGIMPVPQSNVAVRPVPATGLSLANKRSALLHQIPEPAVIRDQHLHTSGPGV